MRANVDNLNLNVTFRAVFSTVRIVAILNDLIVIILNFYLKEIFLNGEDSCNMQTSHCF